MKELTQTEILFVSGGVSEAEHNSRGGIGFSNYGNVIKGIHTIREVFKAFGDEINEAFKPKPHWNQPMTMWHGGF
ncbi:hypothetical protein EOW52_26025 [Salmonella enterica]|uniref:Uncharacterized protein n=1 Tax=Salmonella enterica subsp. enterica serovar Kisarawe TaxID=2517242 RepID=A0A5X8YS89_SALET|nr:hypothetical protein [Salmonella enterica]EBQ8819769.1 hypothetical protein [Salmonella enterica subsp. enterica serovar Kisarawe]EBS0228742.1 hypothetical protein [Salmonella enterica subsp. enterica serovar Schwarzengrund]EAS5879230.1 hypothetical protein [Salmonella enterica]EAU6767309.1 hypothetical protein [Salmonella enterica]